MTSITFDTLRFANRLKAAGLDPKLAEAHAEAEAEVYSNILSNELATKHDLHRLEAATKSDLRKLESKIDLSNHAQLIKFGGMLAGGITLLAILMTLFEFH